MAATGPAAFVRGTRAKVNPVHQHTFATLSLALAGASQNHGMLQSLPTPQSHPLTCYKASLLATSGDARYQVANGDAS